MALANLIFSLLLTLFVVIAFVPIRRDPITGWCFSVGWPVSEFAGQILVLDGIIVLVLGAFGGWRGQFGETAIVFNGLAFLGLAVLVALGFAARGVVARALAATPGYPVTVTADHRRPHWGRWWRVARAVPLPSRDIAIQKNIAYLDDGVKAHRLDIIQSKITTTNAPVMLYVHGGAWVFGDKREQGKPMMFELAARGWVCVTVNYRLSPKATWPDHIVDVKAAIAWVKEHIGEYGGDPNFVVISGGSAGGHLAALAALSANDPAFQPGFESVDTSLAGCVSLYGVLEMTSQKDIGGRYGKGLKVLLEKQVMKTTIHDHLDLFKAASPYHRLRADAPPFLLLHGTNDTLVPVAVPRAFAPALREVSQAPVGYIELPFAQHAFDTTASPRSSATTQGIVAFLDAVYGDYLQKGEK